MPISFKLDQCVSLLYVLMIACLSLSTFSLSRSLSSYRDRWYMPSWITQEINLPTHSLRTSQSSMLTFGKTDKEKGGSSGDQNKKELTIALRQMLWGKEGIRYIPRKNPFEFIFCIFFKGGGAVPLNALHANMWWNNVFRHFKYRRKNPHKSIKNTNITLTACLKLVLNDLVLQYRDRDAFIQDKILHFNV